MAEVSPPPSQIRIKKAWRRDASATFPRAIGKRRFTAAHRRGVRRHPIWKNMPPAHVRNCHFCAESPPAHVRNCHFCVESPPAHVHNCHFCAESPPAHVHNCHFCAESPPAHVRNCHFCVESPPAHVLRCHFCIESTPTDTLIPIFPSFFASHTPMGNPSLHRSAKSQC